MAIRDEAHNNRSSQGELNALRAALDSAGALIFSKDSHCRYTYANQRFCELVGASLEEVVGHTADEFFDADTAALLHEYDAETLSTGQSMQLRETRFFKNRGARHRYLTVKTPIIGPQGDIVGLAGVSIDITESEHLEQVLNEKQQLLDAILDNVDGYIYLKSRDHRYLYVNRASAALFQRAPEQIIGRQDVELLPPEMVRLANASDDEVFARGKGLTTEIQLQASRVGAPSRSMALSTMSAGVSVPLSRRRSIHSTRRWPRCRAVAMYSVASTSEAVPQGCSAGETSHG